MSPFPAWLHALSIASLLFAFACAGFILLDERRRPQRMAVMAWVWPLCALFGGVIWLLFYLRRGRGALRGEQTEKTATPFAVSVSMGASHCGAGCTLGDILAEWTAALAPGVAAAFGWGWLFQEKTFAVWVLDFLLAFLIGIAFQYFALRPMRDDPPGKLLMEAVKADAASIASWQVGMYGAMAAIQFCVLKPVYGGLAPVTSPEFWAVMQVAMLAGFVTAWPVNAWLIKAGVKEAM